MNVPAAHPKSRYVTLPLSCCFLWSSRIDQLVLFGRTDNRCGVGTALIGKFMSGFGQAILSTALTDERELMDVT